VHLCINSFSLIHQEIKLSMGENTQLVLAGVLISLIVIHLASKVGGEICIRLNLPPVLGELLGGVLVGVSALRLLMFPDGSTDVANSSLIIDLLQSTAGLAPTATQSVFDRQSEVISVLSEIGVIILLFEIGLESSLTELLKVGTQAATVAVVGVLAPFISGVLGMIYIFHAPPIVAIFAAAALTATSIGITAKVLSQIGRINTPEGQIIIGAAILDDILGLIVLAVVSGLGQTGQVDIGGIFYLIITATTFLVGAILLGRAITPFLAKIVDNLQTRGQLIVVSLIFAFTLAYIATAIHLEGILGSFAAGLVLAETEKREGIITDLTPLADAVVPIFFVVVGARTDLSVLNPIDPTNREGLLIALFLIVVAVLGKLVTGFVVFGKPNINRLAIGVGMIPRGEVGLIFVSVGATSGILPPATQAGVVVMVIFTTFLAPPLLRLVFKDPPVPPSPQVPLVQEVKLSD
jgi:Kef-type K+ transport system membrane component KefB